MTATFYVGDVLDVLGKLPENSVDLILSSPPFLALRSYLPADHPLKEKEGGSQSTPGEYIDWLLDVVEACDRVLAPHGSLCLELGDTYSAATASGNAWGGRGVTAKADGSWGYDEEVSQRFNPGPSGPSYRDMKAWPLPKSLSLIPESFRFAMVYGFNPFTGRQTDRWRLRNVIRWVRPNPPVGALGDKFRPATSELMVFCKSAKRYFDLDVVREPSSSVAKPRNRQAEPSMTRGGSGIETDGWHRFPNVESSNPAGAPPLDWWKTPARAAVDGWRKPCEKHGRYDEHPYLEDRTVKFCPGGSPITAADLKTLTGSGDSAPPLDWWNIPPGGYEGAHYAVWPPELLIKPIKAMCPEFVCRTCGEPRRRIISGLSVEREQIASLIGERRVALELRRHDLVSLFIGHYKNAESVLAQISNWELGKNVPVPRDWSLLKDRLGIDTIEFDDLIEAEYRWNDAEYSNDGGRGFEGDRAMGRGGHQGMPRANRKAPDRFTDCRHNDYRPGLVLDPFVGSGTTLAVATGHGRNAIGIDLDARNFDLALQRVGPLVLERGEVAA